MSCLFKVKGFPISSNGWYYNDSNWEDFQILTIIQTKQGIIGGPVSFHVSYF
jgi:hypothetical protein